MTIHPEHSSPARTSRPISSRGPSRVAARLMVACLLPWLCAGCGDSGGKSSTPPNILFIIMDDVGMHAVGLKTWRNELSEYVRPRLRERS